jgi:polygalacturonase
MNIINVKDFGAKDNNKHDNTAAIQAAINSIFKGTIYFPIGFYIVS